MPYATVMYGALACATLFALVAAKHRPLSGAPLAQLSAAGAAARHNTFIALAVSERLFGLPKASTVAALTTAVLVPVTNVTVVVTLMVGDDPR